MEKVYIYVRGGVIINITDEKGKHLLSSQFKVIDYDDQEAEEID